MSNLKQLYLTSTFFKTTMLTIAVGYLAIMRPLCFFLTNNTSVTAMITMANLTALTIMIATIMFYYETTMAAKI